MDEAALKLITDEEFDFELACSPATAGQDNIPGNVVDPKSNPEPRQLLKLTAAGKEGNNVTCAAESPISEAALMQIFTDAQNVASHIESCRLPSSCHANRLGFDGCASDMFACSPDVLISPGMLAIVDDDSFELMPGLRGAFTRNDTVDVCLDDVTANLDDGCKSQPCDTAIADLRSRLDRVKSQSAIARSQHAAQMVSGDACTDNKVGLSSDDPKITDCDVEGERLLASAGISHPSCASNDCVLDQCEPDVIMCQGTSNSADDNCLQPDMCGAVTANDKESVRCGKQSSARNCNRLPPRRSEAGGAKTGGSQSTLGRMKTQSRLSTTQKSQNTLVQNHGLARMTQPVSRSSSLRLPTGLKPQNASVQNRTPAGTARPVARSSSVRLSMSNKSQNAPVQNRTPAGTAQPVARSSSVRLSMSNKSQNAPVQNRTSAGTARPVARSSSVRLSMSNKSQNAPAENRASGQAVVRGSSLRRIPSFRRGQPGKQQYDAGTADHVDSTKTSKGVVDGVSTSTSVETTPERRDPPVVQQGTITKDRTRRLERVAGPDVPITGNKVQRPNSVCRSMSMNRSTGGAPASASADTAQKSGSMGLRRSVGPTALSARPSWGGTGTGAVRKSVGTAAPPKTRAAPLKATASLSTCTTAPLKATGAPPKATGAPPKAIGAPPKASGAPSKLFGLKRGAMVTQRPAGPLQKPVIKKPMTKLELVKPGSLLSRTAAPRTRGSATPVGRPAVQGAGPLKATLPLTAAAVHQQEGETSVCPTTVTKVTDKSAGRGSGLMLTPVCQDKCIRPKRLMPAATPPQANRASSVSSGTPLCRGGSFLPTPTKRQSSASGSSASSSRLTSSSSLNTSVFSERCSGTPVTRVLTDVNGLDSNPSSGGLKLRRPLVQHTPVNKENIAELTAPSVWSPVHRQRVMSREEEATQCTKHGAPVC